MERIFTITSKKEYSIDNDKIVNNRIRTVDYEENVDTTTAQTVTGSYDKNDSGNFELECSVDCYIPNTVVSTNSGGILRRYYPCYFTIENATSWDMFFSVVEPKFNNKEYVKLASEATSYENFKSLVEAYYATDTTFEGSWVCAYGVEHGERVIYFTLVRHYSGVESEFITSFECKYRQILTQTRASVYSIDGKTVSDYSLDTNELVTSNTKSASGTIGQLLCEKITTGYKNGKQTATIKCSVGDFYSDEYQTEKVIDIDNAETASVGDTVVPYVRTGRKGGWQYDAPLSSDGEGNAKSFDVIGVEHVFDGAIWQVLTLIESV